MHLLHLTGGKYRLELFFEKETTDLIAMLMSYSIGEIPVTFHSPTNLP